MSNLNMKCYVCTGNIKTREEAVYIGLDKEKKEIFRHRKCSPLGLKSSPINQRKKKN